MAVQESFMKSDSRTHHSGTAGVATQWQRPETVLKLGPLRDDVLTHTHWYHLNRIQDCSNLFHVATLEIEGNGAFFYDWFPQLSWLLDELDNGVPTLQTRLGKTLRLQHY